MRERLSLRSRMPKSRRNSGVERRINRALLRDWALPAAGGDDDKDARGRVLIVGGSNAIPGAVVLAGIAALRAGAGKLQIASTATVSPLIGVSVPEAMSIGLGESANGEISSQSLPKIVEHSKLSDATLIGPGMANDKGTARLVARFLAGVEGPALVLDAAALSGLLALADSLHRFGGKVVLTPHTGEMATMLGVDKSEVDRDPASAARQAATTLRAVVILKGSHTFIAAPDGEICRYAGGDVGLATSGSGDALAGIVAGLLARGATPLHASAWAVFLHGEAGNALAKKMGRTGFLARELLAEIPAIMNRD